jgi:hypothetical protein
MPNESDRVPWSACIPAAPPQLSSFRAASAELLPALVPPLRGATAAWAALHRPPLSLTPSVPSWIFALTACGLWSCRRALTSGVVSTCASSSFRRPSVCQSVSQSVRCSLAPSRRAARRTTPKAIHTIASHPRIPSRTRACLSLLFPSPSPSSSVLRSPLPSLGLLLLSDCSD